MKIIIYASALALPLKLKLLSLSFRALAHTVLVAVTLSLAPLAPFFIFIKNIAVPVSLHVFLNWQVPFEIK